MKIAIVLLLMTLVTVFAQRPPPTPVLPDQWSAFFEFKCQPISCGGKGYIQYDYINNRTFYQFYSPSSGVLSYSLSLYDEKTLYVFNSDGCEKKGLKSQPSPTFLQDAFYEETSGKLISYSTLAPWPEFWFDQNERHRWVVKVLDNTTMASEPFSYAYLGPISLESRDYINMIFIDFLKGPSSLNPSYWNVPDICK